MKQIHFLSHSLADTEEIACRVVSLLDTQGVIALTGDLGSGKTAFTQCLANHLKIKTPLTSPTFTLVQEYPHDKGLLIHSDFYRLTETEIPQLGLNDHISQPNTLVVVEWADRLPSFFPLETIWLHFEVAPHHRIITFKTDSQAQWQLFQQLL
jgi:tRNA threonylcarbamoyladenosine biosynthesis protein TsaE